MTAKPKKKSAVLAKFDAAEFLDDETVIAEYLNAALAEDDPAVFLAAVANVVRARGISAVAAQTGLGRESLYKTIAPGAQPRYDTVMRLVRAMGVKLSVAA
jgi:probable addiction module antidote protein